MLFQRWFSAHHDGDALRTCLGLNLSGRQLNKVVQGQSEEAVLRKTQRARAVSTGLNAE